MLQHLKWIVLGICILAIGSLAPVEGKKGKKGREGGFDMERWMKNMSCKGEVVNKESFFKGLEECKVASSNQNSQAETTTTISSSDSSGSVSSDDEDPEAADVEETEVKQTRKLRKGRKGKKMAMNQCVKVCQKKEQGILNGDGDFEESGAESYIQNTFPESVQNDILTKWTNCATQLGEEATRMDNNCEGFKAFNRCTNKAFLKACELEDKKGKKIRKGKKYQKSKNNQKEEEEDI